MTTYLILGGGGPFGTALSVHLLKHTDARVVSVGRSPEKPPAYALHRGIADERFTHYECRMGYGREDIHRTYWLIEMQRILLAEQPDYIVNFAALAAPVWHDAHLYYRTNVVALAELTEWLCGQSWLKHWVQIGSSEVYGSCDFAVTEDQPPNPSTPYAISKVAADWHLLALSRTMGFPLTILRPSNCYGPGQPPYRVIPRAILAALTGGKLPLEGGGRAEKSYMHAADLARAIVMAADCVPTGQIYHLGPPAATSIRDLVAMIAETCSVRFDDLVTMAPDRPGQDARYLLSSEKAKAAFGWAPLIPLNVGILETVQWVKDNLAFLQEQPREYILRP